MKNIRIPAFAAACVLVACGSEPKQYTGVIEEASMNTVAVKSLTEERTIVFSTADADMSDANGLLIGNIATVDYKGELRGTTPATKVSTDPAYAKAVGEWTMPDPLAPDSLEMGIRLSVEGEAESIRMATLRYTAWELQGETDRIVLTGESEGSEGAMRFTQTAVLGTNAEGRETLSIEGTEIVLTKRTQRGVPHPYSAAGSAVS